MQIGVERSDIKEKVLAIRALVVSHGARVPESLLEWTSKKERKARPPSYNPFNVCHGLGFDLDDRGFVTPSVEQGREFSSPMNDASSEALLAQDELRSSSNSTVETDGEEKKDNAVEAATKKDLQEKSFHKHKHEGDKTIKPNGDEPEAVKEAASVAATTTNLPEINQAHLLCS